MREPKTAKAAALAGRASSLASRELPGKPLLLPFVGGRVSKGTDEPDELQLGMFGWTLEGAS